MSDTDTTIKVRITPEHMQTELDLAHKTLYAAIEAQDRDAIHDARILIARLQKAQREARQLLYAHLCDRMQRTMQVHS